MLHRLPGDVTFAASPGGSPVRPSRDDRDGWVRVRPAARRLLLVELAHQRQREKSAHVLEARADLETDSVPTRIALDVLDRDLSLAERLAAPQVLREVFLLRDVLTDPLVQLAIEIALLLPAPDVLSLDDLDVVREPRDDEHVRKLGAEPVVGLGVLALGGAAEGLGLLARVRGKERRVVAALAHGERDEPLFRQLVFAPLGD